MSDRLLDFASIKTLDSNNHVGRDQLSQWFNGNKESIFNEVMSNINRVYQSGKDLNLCGNAAYYGALPDVFADKENIFALSHIVHAGCAFEGESCHRIIFGELKPVILTGKIRNVIHDIMNMTYHQANLVYQYLEDHSLHTNNPSYIFKARCFEQACKEGKDLSEYLSSHSKSGRRSVLRYIQEDQPLEATLKRSEIQIQDVALFMVISVCIQSNLPADYFLVQDYSGLAYWDENHKLTNWEANFLSVYLNASLQAQEEVVRYIGLCSLGIDAPLGS